GDGAVDLAALLVEPVLSLGREIGADVAPEVRHGREGAYNTRRSPRSSGGGSLVLFAEIVEEVQIVAEVLLVHLVGDILGRRGHGTEADPQDLAREVIVVAKTNRHP